MAREADHEALGRPDGEHDPRRREACRRLDRDGVADAARPRDREPLDPGAGPARGAGAGLRAEPPRPPARRAPARRQRDRLPRPLRPLLRRGRARLRRGRRRARALRADPVHARSRGRRRARAPAGRPLRRPGRPRPDRRRRGLRAARRARHTARPAGPRAAGGQATRSTRSTPRTPAPRRRWPRTSPRPAPGPSRSWATRASPPTWPSASTVSATVPLPTGWRSRCSSPARWTRRPARRVANELTALPDALACANDELALGLLTALRTRGVRVPQDVLVTGWDDVMAARYAGLTTVRQPMRALGGDRRPAARRTDQRGPHHPRARSTADRAGGANHHHPTPREGSELP